MLTEIITKDCTLVEKELKSILIGNPDYDALVQAEAYSLFSGGKRIRPFLLIETCKAFGGDEATAVKAAAALEMIHTYSLIHDDLPCMDNDDFRRGKPSCHKAFGEATALLAGDALLTDAFGVAAFCGASAEQTLNVIAILSSAAGTHGMVGGQYMDLNMPNGADRNYLDKMQALKTGALISAAVRIGICLTPAATFPEVRTAMLEYAEKIGRAFQIADDLLDYKESGADAEPSSILTVMTPQEAEETVRALTEQAVSGICAYKNTEVLCEFAYYLAQRTY